MHEHMTTSLSIGGAAMRRQIQGSSLFGLERFGDGKLDRRHGYSAGRITVDDRGEASMRMWPRIARKHAAGHLQLIPDYDNFELEDDDQGTRPERLQLTNTGRTAQVSSPELASQSAATGQHPSGRTILHARAEHGWRLLTDADDEGARAIFAEILNMEGQEDVIAASLGIAAWHGLKSISGAQWESYIETARREAQHQQASSELRRAIAIWHGLFCRITGKHDDEASALAFLKLHFGSADPFTQPMKRVVKRVEGAMGSRGPSMTRGSRAINGRNLNGDGRRLNLQDYVRLENAMRTGRVLPSNDPLWRGLENNDGSGVWLTSQR